MLPRFSCPSSSGIVTVLGQLFSKYGAVTNLFFASNRLIDFRDKEERQLKKLMNSSSLNTG